MSLIDDLRAACPSLCLNEPVSRHTTLGIGGPADFYANVGTVQELTALKRASHQLQVPVFFLGAGSNLLVSDRGIRGLVIHLQGDFKRIEFHDTRLEVGAAAWMPTLAKQAAERGLAGIEPLIGIPGTLGGGLIMNAGTREGCLGDVVVRVEMLNESFEVDHWDSKSLRFEYRKSNLEGRWILGAELALKREEPASIMKRMEALLQYRAGTQPLATSNCGSVFKNPSSGAAARYIEQAGFKGLSVGGARVSERHANFIVNDGTAKARDVQELIRRIQETVHEKFAVQLEPEVKFVGEW